MPVRCVIFIIFSEGQICPFALEEDRLRSPQKFATDFHSMLQPLFVWTLLESNCRGDRRGGADSERNHQKRAPWACSLLRSTKTEASAPILTSETVRPTSPGEIIQESKLFKQGYMLNGLQWRRVFDYSGGLSLHIGSRPVDTGSS